jgi:hypothetical protein
MATKSSSSFGHKVEVLRDDQARHYGGDIGKIGPRWACAKCKAAPAAFATVFMYVTGKSGRTTDRWQAVCRDCAAKFAAKNRVPMPESAPDPMQDERSKSPQTHPSESPAEFLR